MAGFSTVGDVLAEVRVLVMDEDAAGYRYTDASILQAMNEGLLETDRLRPDFFRGYGTIPQYAVGDVGQPIAYPQPFIPALVDYVCGRVQLRDDESTTDTRAAVFITSFRRILLTPTTS